MLFVVEECYNCFVMKFSRSTLISIIAFFTIYAISCIFKLSSNIIMPIFQQRFALSHAMTGLITGAYYIGYAPMQLFASPLCKKWGTHNVIGGFILLSMAGALFWAFAKGSAYVLIGRFLLGIGVGPAYIGILYYITTITDKKTYALLAGIANCAGNAGGIMASAPIKMLVELFDIRGTFLFFALLLATLSTALFILGKNENRILTHSDDSSLKKNIKDAFKTLISSKILKSSAVVWMSFNVYQLCYIGLWSAKWANEAYNASSIWTWSASIGALGLCLGTLLSEFFRRKNESRFRSAITSEYLFALSGFLVVFAHNLTALGITSITGIFVVKSIIDFYFGFAMGHMCIQITAVIREIAPREVNATILGIINGLGSLSCLVFQWLTGAMYDAFHRYYTPNTSYNLVFLLVSFLSLIFVLNATYILKKADKA